jgi:hypothetical protein
MRSTRIVALSILTVFGVALGGAQQRSFAQSQSLPPGHPPISGQDSSSRSPAPPGDNAPTEQVLTWKAPAGWTPQTPASSMRRAQYSIPGASGPGECAVFYFGPGQGGDAESNAMRWAGQFRRPDGKPIGDAFKTRVIKAADIPVLMVEVTGTYVGGMGGTPSESERPNQMLLGAVAKGPDANWFFRAIGPRATMEAQRAAFEGMIGSLRRGQSP